MQKNLVIVESPAKAKTIEKFLGNDFKVMSSYGHIRDLKKKEMSIDRRLRRFGSHPMKTVKERLSRGICVRSWDSTRKKLIVSSFTKLPSLPSWRLLNIHVTWT